MDERIDQAFAATPRENFLPEDRQKQAGVDAPLPIGFGQTNSQPSTVAVMLEWLDVQLGDKVLDVGSGSGWTSALLSRLVGDKGQVYAVELEPELVKFGRQNCQQLDLTNVSFFQAGDSYGLPEQAPYQRILVSAAAKLLPPELMSQLAIGGKMVIPVDSNVLEITKTSTTERDTITHPGFAFVPLNPTN